MKVMCSSSGLSSGKEISVLIQATVEQSDWTSQQAGMLLHLLESNSEVCTTRLGRTGLLKHKIFTTSNIAVKQQPYRLSWVKKASGKGSN